MREDSKIIIQQILAFIEKYANGTVISEEYERDFNDCALKLFRYQFQRNSAYKKLCQTKRKSPLNVRDWREIPPMPIQGFKELTLTCEPIEESEAVFMTSGTTNPEKKGRNYHPTLAVWDASMKYPYKHFVLPDRDNITTFVISPAEDQNHNSSLSRYLTHAVSNFGTDDSRYFFKEQGLDMNGIVQGLQKQVEKNEPVLLIGATFAYVHLLEYCTEHYYQFHLPEGSRIFDTGGFKGQSKEVSMEELYTQFQTIFDIPRDLIINMYGMTELSSQIYDQTIFTKYFSDEVIFDKKGPAWVQTLVLDTDTLTPVEEGKVGVLAHYDLANWNAALAILTEDLGVQTQDGFVLLGRVKGSEARGCSIAVDQLLQSQHHSI